MHTEHIGRRCTQIINRTPLSHRTKARCLFERTAYHFAIGTLLIIWTIFSRHSTTTRADMHIIFFPIFCIIPVW